MAEQGEQPGDGENSSGSSSLEKGARPAEETAGAEEAAAKVEEGEPEKKTTATAATAAAATATSTTAAATTAPSAPLAPSSSWEEHECRICYNRFDLERRAPKLLECLHTFCQECLGQLHLRAALAAQAHRRGAAEGGGSGGLNSEAAITCPLCRHPTALPDCSVHGLPLNTKLVEHISLRAAWCALVGSQRQALLLLPKPAHQQRPPPAASSLSERGATPSSALAQQRSSGLGGGCSCSTSDPGWRRKAVNLGCLCVVFCVLSMLLLFFAWMNWLTGSIFIGVAVLLLFVSTVPFARHGFRNRTGAGAAVAILEPGAANGAATAAYGASPRSRPASDRRSRS